MKYTLSVFFLFLACSVPSYASPHPMLQTYNYKFMLSACEPIARSSLVYPQGGMPVVDFPDTYETGVCWSTFSFMHIRIVHETTLYEQTGKRSPIAICLPPGTSTLDLIRIFSRLGLDLDKYGDNTAYTIIQATFQALYQCKTGSRVQETYL